MPELKIKCPYCNSIIGTGIALGEGAKFRPHSFRRNATRCPNCKRSVIWNGEDVVNTGDFQVAKNIVWFP